MASIGKTVVTVTPTLDLSLIVAQLRELADRLESRELAQSGEVEK
jgi:hypothetical protein